MNDLRGSASFRSPLSLPVILQFVFAVEDKWWGGGGSALHFATRKVSDEKRQLNLSRDSARLCRALTLLSSLQLRLREWQSRSAFAITGKRLVSAKFMRACFILVPLCGPQTLPVLEHMLKNSCQSALPPVTADTGHWSLVPTGMCWHFQRGTRNSGRICFPVLTLSSWMLWLNALHGVIKAHVNVFPSTLEIPEIMSYIFHSSRN